MFPKINEKGFNLFTALISFLLIMLAVLLIQSMIQTERNAADTISNIETRNELEATAEMARADAMQVFNYALRERIEDWLTDEERGVVMLELQNKSWEQIQQEFAESKFGTTGEGSKFADFAASSLEGIFYSPSHFGNYTISIEGSETLKPGLRTTISKSIDDFFTVVGCPDGDPRDCPLGTFYVNLHLERLSQQEYENLPRLHVIDKKTGEDLKEIILPRTTFRIYVPLRFFKAIAEARALTHFPLGVDVDSPQDRGLFSPRVHNEIEEMALGMCDFGYCAPRTDPFKEPRSTESNKFCAGDSEAPEWKDGLFTRLESDKPWFPESLKGEGATYNANNNEGSPWLNMKETLAAIASAKVCDVVRQAKAEGYMDTSPNDLFTIVGNECEVGGTKLAYDISINADARDSKVIGKDETGLALTDPGRDIGLYRNPETGNVDYPSIARETLQCTDSEADYKARCAEVKSVKVTIAFREEDENYMVRTPREGEEHLYRIAVYDNTYVPFTANWNQGTIGPTTYLYGMPPETTNCSMASGQGWYCKTIWSTEEKLGDRRPIACKPA